MSTPAIYSRKEDIANALSHGVGIFLGIIGLIFLLIFAVKKNNPYEFAGYLIFGLSIIILYSSSTIYHLAQDKKLKEKLRILDHTSIFLLIAGSYTPFTLTVLKGTWGWSILITIWTIAILGIVLKLFYTGKYNFLSTMLYLFMGWIVIIAIVPLLKNLNHNGFLLLLIGGLFYSIGIIFYLWKKLPFNHFIWHLFVLSGTICQYFSVLLYT